MNTNNNNNNNTDRCQIEIQKTMQVLDDIFDEEVGQGHDDSADVPTRYQCDIRFESSDYEKLSKLLCKMREFSEFDSDSCERYGVFMVMTGMWSSGRRLMRQFLDDNWGCLNDISPTNAVIKKMKNGNYTFTICDDTWGGLPFKAIDEYVSRNPDVNITLNWADTWNYDFGHAQWIDGVNLIDEKYTTYHKYKSAGWKQCIDKHNLEGEWKGMWGIDRDLDFDELPEQDDE